jgi:hypothetical protein
LDLVDISTVVGGVASVVGTLLACSTGETNTSRSPGRTSRRRPPLCHQLASSSLDQPSCGPPRWRGGRRRPRPTGRAAIAWQSAAAYLLGAPGGLLMLLLSRRPEVRYHALQSIGITALSMGYAVLASVPYVISVYWTVGYPSFTLLTTTQSTTSKSVA